MKLKEKMKRFLSLDVHGHEGFTLVELIIVIAILAILSGVAIAGYSAYIEKANKAADESLLYEVNQAFQTACIMSNVDFTASNFAGKMPLNADGTINMNGVEPASVRAAFAEYFQVSNAKFKVYKSLKWDTTQSKFVEGTDLGVYGELLSLLTGSTYEEAIAKLNSSTFITADGLGIEGLMNKVADVTDLAADIMGNSNFSNMFNGEVHGGDYVAVMAASMGYDLTKDEDIVAFTQAYEDLIDKKVEALAGKPVSELSPEEYNTYKATATNQIQANNAVLTAAQNTNGKTTEQLLADVKTGFSANELAAVKNSGEMDADTLTRMATAYAMYTAYAYQLPEGPERDAAIKNTENIGNVINAINDKTNTSWQAYLNNTAGDGKAITDLEAYMASMDMINGCMSQDPAASEDLLLNGFDNEKLVELLKQATGND